MKGSFVHGSFKVGRESSRSFKLEHEVVEGMEERRGEAVAINHLAVLFNYVSLRTQVECR